MARTCDSCGDLLQQEQYLEMQLRVLKTSESQDQDQIENNYGDYCDGCIESGAAQRDVLSGLNYTLRASAPTEENL